jgi:hypothetical protein
MSRGKVGFLVCRRFMDKELFIQRCRDTANDDRGYIVPLDDDDLQALADARANGRSQQTYQLLMDRFDRLIN